MVNEGDLTYAHVEFDERTLRGLASVAMDVGDPLTEAVCWNATWRMVIRGELAAADFVSLVLRRLDGVSGGVSDGASGGVSGGASGGASGGVSVVAAEVLLERAVSGADTYAPGSDRGPLRERIARAALAAAERVTAGGPLQRVLAAGFAASADGAEQFEVLRAWLSRPAGLVLDTELRGRILMTLSARGLAGDDDLAVLATADPVGGRLTRLTCLAMRPEPAAKEAAWTAALSDTADWPQAQAYARGVWVPGQEALMVGYRDRYFAEALPALDGREPRAMRRLAAALYPAVLAEPATLEVTRAALERGGLSHGLRVVVSEQEAMLRSVLAARSALRRPDWPGRLPLEGAGVYSSRAPASIRRGRRRLFVEGAGVGGDVDGVLTEHVQRDDLQRALVGGGQHHRSRGAVAVRAQPVRRGHAPPVPRHQAGEAELGHRRGQVIADAALMREELRGHHRADRVAAQVLGSGGAAPVPVEPGERIGSTWLELPAEHVSVAHACSISMAAARAQDQRPSPVPAA